MIAKLGLAALVGTIATTAFAAPASACEHGMTRRESHERFGRYEHERRERERREHVAQPRYRTW